MKRSVQMLTFLITLALALSACAGGGGQQGTTEPGPQTTEGAAAPEGTEEMPATGGEAVVEFWSTDNEEDRIAVYEEVAQRFMDENPGIDVRIVPVDEASTAQRIATARAANQLPAVIRLGVERVPALLAEGLLDEEAATAVINSIGADQFRERPLEMVQNVETENYAAVPFDGWLQAIWYRTDVFDELGLEAPVTWDAINAACDQLPGSGDLLYGITVGTDPGQNYGHQLFEQVAISNNAWPFDDQGNLTFNTPEMIQALEFYSGLQRCAPPGPQYWRGARESYELGQSGMMIYSTYIMDDLVEGSPEAEDIPAVQIAVEDLAGKTGFAPTMQGPNGEGTYGQLVVLAIMDGAPPETQQVVEYFLTEGYIDVLELAPFGKVPVTQSAADEWKTLSPYFEQYSGETLDQILNGYDTMQRWLFRPDYTPQQQAVIGEIENRLLIPQAISNIVLEGSMTPETAAQWLQEQIQPIWDEQQQQQ